MPNFGVVAAQLLHAQEAIEVASTCRKISRVSERTTATGGWHLQCGNGIMQAVRAVHKHTRVQGSVQRQAETTHAAHHSVDSSDVHSSRQSVTGHQNPRFPRPKTRQAAGGLHGLPRSRGAEVFSHLRVQLRQLGQQQVQPAISCSLSGQELNLNL